MDRQRKNAAAVEEDAEAAAGLLQRCRRWLRRRGQGRARQPRVAFFFWEGHVGIAPSVINGVRLLAESGYAVEVITGPREKEFAQAPPFPAAVRLVECRPPGARLLSGWERLCRLLPGRWGLPEGRLAARVAGSLSSLALFPDLLYYCCFGFSRLRRYRYTALIGIDIMGLLAASAVGCLKRVPVLYWSLELSFTADFQNPLKRLLKEGEKRCSRQALWTLIQDTERARSLVAENGVSPARILLVPNGPLGFPEPGSPHCFHTQFGLPAAQKVLLHAGVVNPVALSLELSQSAASWPEGWTLVFHERRQRSPEEPYLRQVAAAGSGRVSLSLQPVAYDELDTVIGSGDVGIALYGEDLGPNFTCIAGASGKLAHYLRCGLPVICNALPGLRDLLERYQCGVAVHSLAEIPAALETITAHYERFSRNARRCYAEEYEFGRYFQTVLAVLAPLQGRDAAPEPRRNAAILAANGRH